MSTTTPSLTELTAGSNGTRVNGASIGHREQGSLFDGFPQEGHAEHPLDDGDTLQIADY